MTELPPLREPDPHDYDHPNSAANFKRGVQLLLRDGICWTCGRLYDLTAGPGTEWFIDHVHNPGCPDDPEPEATPVRLTSEFNGAEYTEAEAIWTASQDDDDQ